MCVCVFCVCVCFCACVCLCSKSDRHVWERIQFCVTTKQEQTAGVLFSKKKRKVFKVAHAPFSLEVEEKEEKEEKEEEEEKRADGAVDPHPATRVSRLHSREISS